MRLNLGAARAAQRIFTEKTKIRVTAERLPDEGGMLLDCGVESMGGLEAGRLLAEVCLAGLGQVQLQRGTLTGIDVVVSTDQPVAACMGSQYAGWQIAPEESDGYFAMGSGPMRAAAGKEPLIDEIGCRESSEQGDHVADQLGIRGMPIVGVLETNKLPPRSVFQYIADACGVDAKQVVLLTARTASFAGNVQVVVRSVETALHKMHELGFDLASVRSGFGAAPLPPVAKDDMQGIGWTNDAVLYGGEVTLWVDADDDELATLGPQIPSSASSDYGEPFADVFKRYDGDFYKIDPHLFSPAVVHLQNLRTARRHSFGKTDEALLIKSFQLDV